MNNRIDPDAPRIVFTKWSKYFIGNDEDEDEDEENEDDVDFEFDDDPGHLLLKQFNIGMPQIGDVNKLFNLWIMDTNFPITKEMIMRLDNDFAGIESLDMLSPYKLRIGIGTLFNENKVRMEISSAIKECLDN